MSGYVRASHLVGQVRSVPLALVDLITSGSEKRKGKLNQNEEIGDFVGWLPVISFKEKETQYDQ